MAQAFKERYRHNRETLEWYDALAVAVAVIALIFTFGVRIVQVDGSSMVPTLHNGERVLIGTFLQPDYGDVVVIDSYIPYGKPLVKRVIGKAGDTIDIDFDAGLVYRNESKDSRDAEIGCVDARDVLGVALWRVLPLDKMGAVE